MSSSLSILLGSPYFYPATRYGGPVESQRQLAIRLAARGHRVRVITTGIGVPADIPREAWHCWPEGVEVWYVRESRLTFLAPHFSPRLRMAFRRALAERPILHLNVGYTYLNTVARREAGRLNLPYLLTPRGVYGRHHRSLRRWSKLAFHLLQERRVLRDARLVHVLVEQEAADTVAAGGDRRRLRIVPNGVDPASFDGCEACVPLRHRLGLPADSRILFSLARLHLSKGPDLLIDAFARACGAPTSPWHLVLAGPDEGAREVCERLIARHGLHDRIHLPGCVAGKDKYRWLQDADIFALTSWAEGMPNGVLEACAAAKPVLITDRCNLPEIVSAEAGVVCPPDVHLLAEGLSQLLQQDLAQIGRNARELVKRQFTWDSVTTRMEALYREMLADA